MLEQERSGEDILTDLFGTPELGSELFDINLECLGQWQINIYI